MSFTHTHNNHNIQWKENRILFRDVTEIKVGGSESSKNDTINVLRELYTKAGCNVATVQKLNKLKNRYNLTRIITVCGPREQQNKTTKKKKKKKKTISKKNSNKDLFNKNAKLKKPHFTKEEQTILDAYSPPAHTFQEALDNLRSLLNEETFSEELQAKLRMLYLYFKQYKKK